MAKKATKKEEIKSEKTVENTVVEEIQEEINQDEDILVKLSELVEMCEKQQNGEITYQELIDWSDCIRFRRSIPLREKITIIYALAFDFMYPENMFERFIFEQMYKFWYIILAYTNVKIEEEYLNEVNYDLVYNYCNEWVRNQLAIYIGDDGKTYSNDYSDLDNFEKLYDETMHFLRHEDTIETFKQLANTDFDELIKSDAKVINDLKDNADLVKDIAKILTAQSVKPEVKTSKKPQMKNKVLNKK